MNWSSLDSLKLRSLLNGKMHRLDITQDFYVKCDPSLMVKIIRYAGSVDPYRKGRALHYNQHNEIRSCKFEKRGTILHSMTSISSS